MARIKVDTWEDAAYLFYLDQIGVKLMANHGLAGWTLVWDRATSRGGQCRYGPQEIGISAPVALTVSEATFRNTVLHEIAHALVPPKLINGRRWEMHGPEWRAKFIEIGGNGERCYDSSDNPVPGKWKGTCPNGHVMYKSRRSKRMGKRQSCTKCSPSFNTRYLVTWTENK